MSRRDGHRSGDPATGAPPKMTPEQEREAFGEETSSIFRIALGPTIWAVHFALSYAAVAVYCAKFASGLEPVPTFRLAVGALTILALAGIAWTGVGAFRQWNINAKRTWHEVAADLVEEEEGRHEFLGHAALLLAIISFVGVVFSALPVLYIPSCI